MAHNLQDMNDDCLVEIFKHLSVRRLADVASTCTRFRTIARKVFSLRHKSNCVEIEIEDTYYYPKDAKYHQQSAALLRNFGDLMTDLKVIFEYEAELEFKNTSVMSLMTKYCTGPLEKLELEYLSIGGCRTPKFFARFQNLKILSVRLSEDSYINDIFLRELRRLRQLRTLSIIDEMRTRFLSSDGLVGLIRHLSHLDKLSLEHPRTSGYVYRRFKVLLRESTYLRICEIYRGRNHKLMIQNCVEKEAWLSENKRKELFAGGDPTEFVESYSFEDRCHQHRVIRRTI